ncbi:MAG TPA: SLBB domain-containing protein [Candidatus Angelobacter sp.]|nr:SLBB domain-containing protein [Candidatus Angelobacter sp.]
MSKISRLSPRFCVPSTLSCVFAVCCLLLSGISRAQQQEDSAPLPAEQIIQILQENPDLLADAKAQIVTSLRDRGYAVTQADITDDRLFSQIRSDDRVRITVSDELKKRGYGPENPEEQETPSVPTPQKPATELKSPTQPAPPDKTAATEEKQKKHANPEQNNYPYHNLPVLKDLYTQSIADPAKLERFGAALFRNSTVSDKTSMDIPVSSDYVLGPGDQLVIEYWGSSSQRLQAVVDREGRVVLPEAGGVLVAGRTLGEVQDLIQKALVRQFRDVSVTVSLGRLKTVRAYVVGDVKNPGAYDISSLSTALSALLAAGGPTDTGSLRTVKHYRGKKLVEEIDLYELMLKGVTSGQDRIESGDSILVPPTGPQATVAGMVRRPAIYEIRSQQTLDQVLDLAGGVLVSGELGKIKVERIQAHERKVMLSLGLPNTGDMQAMGNVFKQFVVQDGDIITITPILPYSDKTLYLQGHVFRPGKYPYRDGIKVTDIIASFDDLLPEPADRAEIVRLRPPDYRPSVIGFNLREVLEKHAEAPGLQPFDTIRIFGRYEADAPKVSIYGEVLRPGEYPLSERMSAADLLKMAGGFKRSAYLESADLSSYAIVNGDRVELEHREVPIGRAISGEPDTDVLLKPGDVLTIRQLGGWNNIGGAINVTGEVLHPGRYGIQEGERLSSILKRAGGFLPEAYPYGAVLERDQVRQLSAKNRDELIQKLQTQSVSGDGTGRTESAAIARQRQQLIDRLKQIQPSGRMVIHVTTQIEKWENTPVDVEVRSGDTLIIPRRPNFVLVAGQVYNPTAITYAAGRHAGWYLRQAGGPTTLGNHKEVFVVRANGSVIGRNSGQWWTGNVLSTVLQPGDTIFVPEKISAGDKLKLFSESAQVLSGLAVAARVAISF